MAVIVHNALRVWVSCDKSSEREEAIFVKKSNATYKPTSNIKNWRCHKKTIELNVTEKCVIPFIFMKYIVNYYFLKGCETALQEAPPGAARETLLIVATKPESTAQCGTVPVPPPPPITGLPDRPK